MFGVPDIVQDGETGYLFQAGSIGEVAGAIDRFCSLSADDREQMSRAARDLIVRTDRLSGTGMSTPCCSAI